jgi:hypothetical protein
MKQFTSIKNLTDSRRMPRLGKIRLGAKFVKKGSSTEYPAELPFFLLPDEVAEIHGGHIENPVERAKELGVTRKDVLDFVADNFHRLAEYLPVMLPMDDQAAVFPQSYKMYGGSIGLKCHGDGVTAMERKGTGSDWEEKKCPCKNLKSDENPKGECTIRAHLMVILPDVNMGGVYQIDMGSINSIIDINSGIDYVTALLGSAAMRPLKLSRVKTETHHDGKKQIHYTCQLTTVGDINAIAEMKSSDRLISHAQIKMIEAPDLSDPREDKPDAVYEPPQRIKDMIEYLTSAKKIRKSEAVEFGQAMAENDESAIEAIYKAVIDRDGAKSADDLAEKLKQEEGDPGPEEPPESKF